MSENEEYNPDSDDGIPVVCVVSEPPQERWESCERKLLKEGDTIIITKQEEKQSWSITFVTRKGNKITQRLPSFYQLSGRIFKVEESPTEAYKEKSNKLLVRRTSPNPKGFKNLPLQFIIHQSRKDKKVSR